MSFGLNSSRKPSRGDFYKHHHPPAGQGSIWQMVKQKKEVSAWLASQPSTAKLAIHYYDANKKRHTIKTEGTKEQAQVRLDEILKDGKQSVNTKTNFKDYGQW
jgi:hypothetical protein